MFMYVHLCVTYFWHTSSRKAPPPNSSITSLTTPPTEVQTHEGGGCSFLKPLQLSITVYHLVRVQTPNSPQESWCPGVGTLKCFYFKTDPNILSTWKPQDLPVSDTQLQNCRNTGEATCFAPDTLFLVFSSFPCGSKYSRCTRHVLDIQVTAHLEREFRQGCPSLLGTFLLIGPSYTLLVFGAAFLQMT